MVVITSCEADDCSADYLLDVSALYGTWKFITKLYYRRTQSGGTQQLRIGVQSIEVVDSFVYLGSCIPSFLWPYRANRALASSSEVS
jgi:hypothetical protein